MNGKVLSGILLTFLILAAISDIGDNSLCEAETKDARLHVANSHAADSSKGNANSPRIKTFPDNSNAAKGNAQREIRIAEHRMTEPELGELKSKIGVCVEGKNYNQLVNGHGTGLRPPTEEEWVKIAENAYVVDSVTFPSSSPSVDQSAKPWFPPIGNQDGEGSCTAWAVGYYFKTFQEAKEHAWNFSGATWEGGYSGHPTQSYQDRIISPDFIYHLINRGVDKGSGFENAIELICSVGACSWEKMPYDPADSSTWPSEEAWTEAPLYRGNSSGSPYIMDVSTSITNLKNWIASGNLAVIAVDADKYPGLTSADVWTLDNYVNITTNHANTIVGYDDNVAYTENGSLRYGAFKIANSWGIGGWEKVNDGFYWISYEAMKQRVQYCMSYNDLFDYKPELAATFRISHNDRYECNITLGLGNSSAPIITKIFYPCLFFGRSTVPYCSNNVLFDITEFKDYVPTIYNQTYFLRVGDRGTSAVGTISKFAVEYADSTDTPCQTIDGNYVYLNVTLPALDTTWQDEQLVNSDQDSLDQKIAMTTDSGGNMYVTYADRGSLNLTQIFVRKSSDGGLTWLLIVSVSDDHNLGYPSIAIDPYYNDIYVAFEREWASNDHDIWVLRFVDGNWSCIPVANTLGSDHRFPSVTCEYQFGSSNWQYISYEYVYNSDDRDLMFAKSTDSGATWSVRKLHGDSPDGNVYAQTCITNAEGYLYIAFKWGADYNSVCEIRVERSIDYGDTWSQFSDVDGLSNDCQFPSIAATHGGDTVLVGFQYKWNASDTDIWYSYSINNGSTWTKGQALFTSRLDDEKSPALVVDGEGTQTPDVRGYIHAVCRVGRYAKYRTANCSQPTSWNTAVTINDGWVGKGLVITTRQAHDSYCPIAAWTASRTKNLFSARQPSVPDADFNVSTNCFIMEFEKPSLESSSQTCLINVTSLNDWVWPVDLSGSWIGSEPSDVGYNFNPVSVTPPSNGSSNSTLTVTVGTGISVGEYTLRVYGTSGLANRLVDIKITVNPPSPAEETWSMFHHDLQHTGYSTSTAPNTNNTRWSYTTGGSVFSSPALVDGRVYVGSYDNKTYCLSAATGAFIWSYETGGLVQSSPAVADGKVYVGSDDNKTYCLDAATGALIWNYTTDGAVVSSPAVVDGKVYFGSYDYKVYCLNAATGGLIWNYTTGNVVYSSPAVVGGKAFVGSHDGKMYCLDASTGTLVWNCTIGSMVESSPAVVGDRVYFGSDDSKVYCINATDGALIWSFTTGNWVRSSPAVAEGKVYVGSMDSKVYCLNAATGAHIWNYTTGNWVFSSPAVADDKIFVGSWDSKVYCLNASTGAHVWSYTAGGIIHSSPAVVNGKVYVGSFDGKVYCFGLSLSLALGSVTSWHWQSNTAVNSVAVGDVDDDGQVEAVTGGYYNDGIRDVAQLVVWNSSSLAPEQLTTWYWFGNTTINSVASGDVDGDGGVEIVTGGYYFDGTRQVAQLVVWNGSSLAVEGIRTWYWTNNTVINSVALGDVDGDAQVEIVTGGYYNEGARTVAQLVVWTGSGLSVDRLTTWYWTGNTAINSVAVGDVDADGQVEIVTGGTYFDGTLDVAQLVVWAGSDLAVDRLTTWYWTGDTAINSVAVGDVDGDGQVEIVTGGYHNDGTRDVAQLVIWTGSTLAVDRLTTWYWTGDTVINSVALGDMDGDGQVEIVTSGYYNDGARDVAQMVVWSGSSLVAENIRTWYWVGDTVINAVCLSDTNGDFKAEIITGGYYHDGIRTCAQTTIWQIY